MRSSRIIVVFVLGLATARPAAAQFYHRAVIEEKPSFGFALGTSENADDNSGHKGLDFSASYEIVILPTRLDSWPPERGFRLRADVGRTSWLFDRDARPNIVPVHNRVSLTRATVSLIRTIHPPFQGYRMGMYAGGGVGAYHYGFRRGSGSVNNRLGVHGLGGLDFILPGDRTAVTSEIRLDVVRGPGGGTVYSYSLPVLSLTAGVRFRL